jgi:hypothetical protein
LYCYVVVVVVVVVVGDSSACKDVLLPVFAKRIFF